jgi:hypothetical protein
MSRIISAVLPGLYAFLFANLAHAAEAEPPIETSNTGVIVFFVLVVVCFAGYGYYTWRNSQKPEEEKLGDKF